MKSWGRVELGSVATISTYHIPEDDLKTLERLFKDRSIVIDNEKHWTQTLLWAEYEYGYMVGGSSLRSLLEEDGEMPDFIREAANLAKDHNLAWLVFDRDGNEVDGMTNWYEDF